MKLDNRSVVDLLQNNESFHVNHGIEKELRK